MKLNISRTLRALACLSMVASFGVALPTTVPGVSEASAAQPRSSIDRRLRPGGGYFANSPTARARAARPVQPMRHAPPVSVPHGHVLPHCCGPTGSAVPVVRSQPNAMPAPIVRHQGQIVPHQGQVVQPQGQVVQPQGQVIRHQGAVPPAPVPQPQPLAPQTR